ncbi:phytoene desaturase family protein [Deminuibacter soli]|uniref:NAD(P)/FAD-dependent oxidoreductase n=1 Tax=Deminuibacter soli TaxID=2291815 RepID=A0A3E1ND34_9BACT|nr:NAD(P)/FAD-dependent oxidoreductase [Deminuibacter soli]RFM25772.1 NAD(P)/FAD-dependent oxidoreductase [Deminuibacter soli]
MKNKAFDAVIVGAGPNGLSAAIALQQAGLNVLLVEAKSTIGGGLRSAALTLPGFVHDVCSAIHPLAMASPFFKTLPLADYGLQYLQPPVAAAHPFDDGSAAALFPSLKNTIDTLDAADAGAYRRLLEPVIKDWDMLLPELLGPLHMPKHPLAMARFGWPALRAATTIAKRFKENKARGLWAGMAAHSIQPLTHLTTSAVGLVLLAAGHTGGWPLPKGGSQAIAQALVQYFIALGGKVETDFPVHSLNQLPSSHAVVFDVTPRQLLAITGDRFSGFYKRQLQHFRYGPGVFKIDWALREPIPFTAAHCRAAGTVHLGNTLEEITAGEQQVWEGRHPDKPFVLLAQQSLFDASRVPQGRQAAWAYCHVPHGSQKDMTTAIENQVERFAPGFKDIILERHVMHTTQLEAYNPNYIGGDINGGILDIRQLYTRPALRLTPYATPAKGIFICSSSTPPGGGVHGMCGYHAAQAVLKDVFHLSKKSL